MTFNFSWRRAIVPRDQKNEDEQFSVSWSGDETIHLRMDSDGQTFIVFNFDERDFRELVEEFLAVRGSIAGKYFVVKP